MVAAFEDDPHGTAESVAVTALGYGADAWGRILAAADRVVVAKLLGGVAIILPEWTRKEVEGAI